MDHNRRFRLHFATQQEKLDWFLAHHTGRGVYTDIAMYLIQPCWSIEFKDAKQAPNEDWAGRPFVIRCNPLAGDEYVPMGLLEALQRIADPNALTGLLMLEEPDQEAKNIYAINATTTIKELRVSVNVVELHGEFITDPSIGSLPRAEPAHRDFIQAVTWWRTHTRTVGLNIRERQKQAHREAGYQAVTVEVPGPAEDTMTVKVVGTSLKPVTPMLSAWHSSFNQSLSNAYQLAGILKLNDKPENQEDWANHLRMLGVFKEQWKGLSL